MPDSDLVKNWLYAGGQLSKSAFIAIITHAASILKKEPNLVRIDGKVLVVGDIHGQFYDLVELLRKQRYSGNSMTGKKILFLGDYVDRGKYQPEVVAYLFAFKAQFPNQVYLLRGNHETREMTECYDFRSQMIKMYDLETYQYVVEMFDQLPLAACVNGDYLAVHGGVSERFKSFEDLNAIERRQEPVDDCLMNDIMWADPMIGEAALK